MSYSEEELAGLSDAERDALNESDTDEIDSLSAIVGDEDGVGDEDDGGEPDAGFSHRYEADPVDGYAEKLAYLDHMFEEGQIPLREYNEYRDALHAAQLKAEISHESAEQEAHHRWKWEIDHFLDDHRSYRENPILGAALDAAVKDLANRPENMERPGRWFLSEAHRLVSESFGRREGAVRGAERGRGPDFRDVPRTLGMVPAAELNDTGGEFANIDRLEGLEFERAFARMSPEQQDRYLRAG